MYTNTIDKQITSLRGAAVERIKALLERTEGEVILPDAPVVTILSEAGPLQISVQNMFVDSHGGVSLEARLATDPEDPPYTLDLNQVILEDLTDLLNALQNLSGKKDEGNPPATHSSVTAYVGRWDLLPDDLDCRIETVEGWTRKETAAEVLRQRKILHSDEFARYGDYKEENIVDSFTLEQFEALFNGDLNNYFYTKEFWVKFF